MSAKINILPGGKIKDADDNSFWKKKKKNDIELYVFIGLLSVTRILIDHVLFNK